MRPLRILHAESSLSLGGQEFATLALTEGLKKRGHAVSLLVRPRSPMARIAGERRLPHHLLVMGKPLYPWAVAKLVSLLRRHHIDIVHTNSSRDNWIGGLAARFSSQRPRVVLTRHKTTPISKNFINNILYHSLADAIVTTGGDVARRTLLEDHGFDDAKVSAIPTGADLTQFSPNVDGRKFRDEIGVGEKDCLVGAVCFLRSYKGLDYVIDAAPMVLRRIPHCRFVIVGDGPEKERLCRKIAEMGLEKRIAVVGHRADVPHVMAALDVCVVTSLFGETLTQTIPQALAMEVPVVATNVGSIPDIVRHGETGFLVPPKNETALAEHIAAMLEHRDLARGMAQRGRRLVVHSFSKESAVTGNERLYYGLLASRIDRRV